MSESWNLGQSGQFCLTLSAGRSPEEVLEIYGADRSRARWLSSADCFTEFEPTATNTVLRVGTLGDWSFCIEFENPIGFLNAVVRGLSVNSEMITISRTGNSLTIFRYIVNGRLVESFEPGNLSSSWGQSEHEFSREVHERSATANTVMASLHVIAEHVGHELTTEILHGPLLSVVIDNPERTVLAHPDPRLQMTAAPETRSTLGRYLGPLSR
ncbi:DUF6461 domain-containing protein [Streptomyces sp. NPDC005474]|uniref:DUF6461 domain-containing protein n=1 Tax=Streptomyces sp. NPDC005474 TaxID=3154878 RepID=UPI003453E136